MNANPFPPAQKRWIIHLCACLTLMLAPLIPTFPLGGHLASHFYMPGDNFITMWTNAWEVHALEDPKDSFWNANIFYPHPRTLALSVLRAIYIPFAALVLHLTDNPVLMENLILLGSIGLSSVGIYGLAYHLTRNAGAAWLAGLFFCCCPERFARLPHPHQVNPIFLGPSLLFLLRYFETWKRQYAVALAACLILQFLTSIYLFVFTVMALGILAASEYGCWKDRIRQTAIAAGMVLGGAGLAIAPFAYPYLHNRLTYHFADQKDWIIDLSARPADYLCAFSTSLLYGWTSSWLQSPRAMANLVPPEFLFMGVIPSLLFLYGVMRWMIGKSTAAPNAVRLGLALAAGGLILSLGPWLHLGSRALPIPLPAWLLYQFVPGFSVVRAPARFSILVTLGVALVMAGVVSSCFQAMRKKHVIGFIALASLLMLECVNRPLPLQAIPHESGIPKVYHWMQSREERVIVCYPLRYHLDYMLYSLWHWKKLLNGWTGYMPNEFFEDERRLNTLPSTEAMETLKRRGAELIVIHRRYDTEPFFRSLTPEEVEGVKYYLGQLEARPEQFEKIYDDGAAAVFRLRMADE